MYKISGCFRKADFLESKIIKDMSGTEVVPAKKLLVVDTDCGVDDALAILLALWSQEWEILAFTSVFGNTEAINAANNVLRLTNATNNRKIPVYLGCSQPLIVSNLEQDNWFGEDGFGGVSEKYPTGDSNAIEKEPAPVALVRLAKENPGQVTLIALGPCTNLAVAHLLDPDFSSNLKQLYVMGGNIEGLGNITVSAEFNFYCDPEAAQRVLVEFKCPIAIVPWELCSRQPVEWDWFRTWISYPTKTAKIIGDVTKFSFDKQWPTMYPQGIPMADLSAVAVVMYPNLVKEELKVWVDVELNGKLTRGQMVVDRRQETETPKARENVSIITEYNLAKLQIYLTELTRTEWIK